MIGRDPKGTVRDPYIEPPQEAPVPDDWGAGSQSVYPGFFPDAYSVSSMPAQPAGPSAMPAENFGKPEDPAGPVHQSGAAFDPWAEPGSMDEPEPIYSLPQDPWGMDEETNGSLPPRGKAAVDQRNRRMQRRAEEKAKPSGHARLKATGPEGEGKTLAQDRETVRGHARLQGSTEGSKPVPRPRVRRLPWVVLMLLCLGILGWMGVQFVLPMISSMRSHREQADRVYADTLPEGVYVDNIALGGLTMEQAEAVLNSQLPAAVTPAIEYVVQVQGGGSYLVTDSLLPFTRNTKEVLQQAYQLPWQGSADTLMTPVEYRDSRLTRIRENGAYFYTKVSFDESVVKSLAAEIASAEYTAAVDAAPLRYDEESDRFVYSEERSGHAIDAQELAASLISLLQKGVYQGTLQVTPTILEPRVTRASLRSTFTFLSEYTLTVQSGTLGVMAAVDALNGTLLQAGERFSFNTCTGERTAARGYVNESGSADDTWPVSTALFNAAALANMTVTERHLLPNGSTIADAVTGAVTLWQQKDLCFTNSTNGPVYIYARFLDHQLTVRFYGAAFTAGESIELMPQKEADGTTALYRIWRVNGTEYRREKLIGVE